MDHIKQWVVKGSRFGITFMQVLLAAPSSPHNFNVWEADSILPTSYVSPSSCFPLHKTEIVRTLGILPVHSTVLSLFQWTRKKQHEEVVFVRSVWGSKAEASAWTAGHRGPSQLTLTVETFKPV